ncbi:hypothetical protein F511_30921 [Dorcoceras hygrometricum]|uniref:Uncharacterized protein n=1 Tax=Dorcoceras hygrometricum TaxID=472368 RepID=A0A2Z7AG91_9LAMI|nr:hypothetical protein F511_30921 [Dorcoceras hygrometricum]
MTFRVVRTNQYNQDLGLIHSTNGNHLESPNEGSSIDHQYSEDAARHRGRATRQITIESEPQNDEGERSIPVHRHVRQVDDEVDVLASRVDEMELIMTRFQRMNPQTFNGDESSSDAESWL